MIQKYDFSIFDKNHLVEVLFSTKLITEKIISLCEEITRDYLDVPLHLLIVSNTGLIFGVDLIKNLNIPVTYNVVDIDYLDSYKYSFKNKHVLIVTGFLDNITFNLDNIISDDMFDDCSSLNICTFLYKPYNSGLQPKYIGFNIRETISVFGYGIKYMDKLSDLPQVWYYLKEKSKNLD